MVKKIIVLLFYSIVSINIPLLTSFQDKTAEESLKQILSFINQQVGQASPAFDLSTKPVFDHVDSALDQIIQRAIYEKNFSSDPVDDNAEITALKQKNILEQLYQENSTLFSTPEDINRRAELSKAAILLKKNDMIESAEFDESYESLPTPTEFSQQYESGEEAPYNDTSLHTNDFLNDSDLLPSDDSGYGLSSDNNELLDNNESLYDYENEDL